ncbi:hypothetical protein LRY65_04200 [Candidatus Woesebacteria bacterium]|nr:hypothetical protein [Candidatus Woesebacteria bacterium]MCD8527380.1 hypothetical protein [Candidatus Woesebacteria bacterium]
MESTTQERPASTFVAKIIEEEQEKAKTLLSSVFDNYRHPIFQAIETIQSLKPSIFQAVEMAQQTFRAIDQALETYRNWIKIMREAYDKLVNFFKSIRWPEFFKNIWQHVQNFVVSFLLAEYHQLHRARDGTESDVMALSHLYPKEFRLFCRMNDLSRNKSARIEFATHFLEALDQADKRSPLDEDNLLVSLKKFFFRLGLILRDLIRKACHELQKKFAREKKCRRMYCLLSRQKIFTHPLTLSFDEYFSSNFAQICIEREIWCSQTTLCFCSIWAQKRSVAFSILARAYLQAKNSFSQK